ncbi:MAG: adenylate/guanylate cyclase domain-containing protein, partial [Armatimonadota bacterium]
DLILSDFALQAMNGIEALTQLKASEHLRHIPVVMISALTDMETVIQCIDRGADDYLSKPFNSSLLRARIGACLEKKRLRDQEIELYRLLEAAHSRAEGLLLNVLPGPIAERLKLSPDSIADHFQEVGVLFADIVDFTALAARLSPSEVVSLLNEVFSAFDALAEQYGLEKIKTIGDSYMAVTGLPEHSEHHARALADMALAMHSAIRRIESHVLLGQPLKLRIGLNIGPVVAGVIGTKRFIYDLWGDTVNIASRMESQGAPGTVQCTEAAYLLLEHNFNFEGPFPVQIKGKGEMAAYRLIESKGTN